MTTLTIKKGRHYHSNWWYHLVNFFAKGKSICEFEFTESCWFPYLNNDSEDWNKLHGIRGWKDMKNEAILVWKPIFENPVKFKLAFYGRTNGKIWFKEIGEQFLVGERIKSEVVASESGYRFMLNGHIYFWPHPKPEGVREIQFYHGGNNKASRKMSIHVFK